MNLVTAQSFWQYRVLLIILFQICHPALCLEEPICQGLLILTFFWIRRWDQMDPQFSTAWMCCHMRLEINNYSQPALCRLLCNSKAIEDLISQ